MQTDPFANLKSLDLDQLDALDLDQLCQPWDDNPDVRGPEVDVTRQLAGDLGHYRTAAKRTIEDLRARPEAVRHLPRLPEDGESYHAVISGRYAMFDLIPAILERSGPTSSIDELWIATLSYSAANAAELLALLDSKRVKAVGLLVSHYFKSQNRHLYDTLAPKLLERNQKVLAMRTHAKLILARMTSGETYTVEGSANLRSCKNVEQFVMTRDADLFRFHRGWIVDELLSGDGTGKVRGSNGKA